MKRALNIYTYKKLNAFIGMILFRITLELIYKYQVYPEWAYSGFSLEMSLTSYVLSWVLFLIFIPLITSNYKFNNPSNSIITILYLVAFIPGLILMAYKPMDDLFFILYILYWLTLTVANRIIPTIRLKKLDYKESTLLFNSVVIVLSIVVLFISYYYTGFRLNFSIFNVYELRSEAKEYYMPTLLTYLFSASRAIFPTLIVYNLSKGRLKITLLLGVIQFLIFSVDGSKSVLFSMILAFVGYAFYNRNRTSWFVWGLLMVNMVSIFEKLLLNSTYVINIFIRRILFLPQLLNYFYYDFFSNNEFDFFKQSILGKFGFASKYDIRIPNLIGANYYGSSANNGLFSDAYYNLGLIGIIVMPFLIILALRFLDACSKDIDIRILIASIITGSLNLMSSSFFTVMLSHGFIGVCIVLYIIPRKQVELNKDEVQMSEGVNIVHNVS
ncbi:MAG: hypothetical protein GT589_00210 [Peptoclostridium sp.]|uniref:O-antigen polymerase n=1 Tax=Peptoclostridium sp. TaxID=1904860 RepID=UPI00139C0B94|nr:O-antigen polymerase [Peptoclostridium sp.]MZQ74566.1 hypothetical protein [Peptoclostridium sp.]